MRQSVGKIVKQSFQQMKTGLKQTIHQGFQRLRRLHDALAVDYNKVQDTLEESEYDLKAAIADGEKECFMGQVLLTTSLQ